MLSDIIKKHYTILPLGSPLSEDPHFYAVIIGSEILNRRRSDKHFDYLSKALAKKGFTLFASLTIKDDATLIRRTFEMVKSDPKAILFSFGGIGSTPDDLTRQISADVFGDGILYRHPQFEKDIIDRLNERAYPHPIKMSDLPKDADLLFNPVNNMSGFYLDERYFFMPGFPEMAQPMMDEILLKYCPQSSKTYTRGFIAQIGEGKLTHLMFEVPKEVELSSLPMMNDGSPSVEFTLISKDETLMLKYFKTFIDFLDDQLIPYELL